MAHFEAVVGDVGPASSFERRHAFLTVGTGDGLVPPASAAFASCYCPGYSDYYSNAKGGHDIGRGIEPVPFDGRVLGDWLAQAAARAGPEPRPGGDDERSAVALPLQPQHPAPSPLGPGRDPDLRRPAARSGAAHERRVADRADARRSRSAARSPIWTEAPLDDLIVEDGARGRCSHRARRGSGVGPGPSRRCCWRPAASPTTRRCERSTAATNRTGRGGRSPTRATPAR